MTELAPFPWSVDYASISAQWTDSVSIIDADGGHVCHLTRGYQGDANGDGCPSFANARLIAAAPDMLEALRAAVDAIKINDVGEPIKGAVPWSMKWFSAASAAIAKAIGEEK